MKTSLSCKSVPPFCARGLSCVCKVIRLSEVMTLQLHIRPFAPPPQHTHTHTHTHFPMIQRQEMQFDAGRGGCCWVLWQLAPAIRSHRGCLISGPPPSLWRSFLLPQYVIECISEKPHTHMHAYTHTRTHTHTRSRVSVTSEDITITLTLTTATTCLTLT